MAVRAARACRDGDSHPSAGRTSLGPATTSTPSAQTSDRRAPQARATVRACHRQTHALPLKDCPVEATLAERTLTDEDFEALGKRVVDNVAKQTGGTLRS